MTVTQPSLGDFGDDLTLDADVVSEAETHEVTLEVHCDPPHVLEPDGWLSAFNLAGVFAYDMVTVSDESAGCVSVTTLRFHYGLVDGDEVHPASEWNQRLRLSRVPAVEVVVITDRKVKRQSRYVMDDRLDDIEDELDDDPTEDD